MQSRNSIHSSIGMKTVFVMSYFYLSYHELERQEVRQSTSQHNLLFTIILFYLSNKCRALML